MTTTPTKPPFDQCILASLTDAAPYFGYSSKHLGTLIEEGKAPPPVQQRPKGKRGGGCKTLIRVQEWIAWGAAGMPPMSEWTWDQDQTAADNVDE